MAMKEYRVDTFMPHEIEYFDEIKDALKYGKEKRDKGKVTFLLRHIADGKYDVVAEI